MDQKPFVSVTRRLHGLFVTSAAVVLLITGLVVLCVELVTSRNQLIERAGLFTGLTSPHLANVLALDSPILAHKLLENYFSEPDLLGIYVYRNDGSLLVELSKPELTLPLPEPSFLLRSQLEVSHSFSFDLFEYSMPVRTNRGLEGQIYLQYSLAGVKQKVLFYLLFGVSLYLLSLLGVYLLSKRIQAGLTEPIDQLLDAMEQVSVHQNYDLKIYESRKKTELSSLISGFNRMLVEINKNARELKSHQKVIEQHVYFDPLTGLANRRLLMQNMEREVVRARRTKQFGALVYMDLDHFKTINDSLGHSVGDAILNSVSARIRKAIRQADTPARLGGDEFVVLLPELGQNESSASHNALSVAEKVRQSISEVHSIEGRSLHVTPSIGIALFDGANDQFENLIMQADLAMYRAKEEGRNQVQFFLEQMQEHADHRQQIEERLREAIEKDRLYVSYQPLVRGAGKIVGAEALLRWPDGENGLINPSAFIPIAEMTDLICCLGNWVLTEVCRQMAEWEAQGRVLVVSVNISPREFQQENFVEQVQEVVISTGVRADCLVFELTEGVLLTNVDKVRNKMRRLSELGIRFSLDDFGTGYSSLQYLKQLPINTLKIDQSFVRDITTDSNDAAIVATIIAMARSLDIDVVAEGVEKKEELAYLIKCGCTLFQGFYFSRPVRAKRMASLIPSKQQDQVCEVQIQTLPTHQFTD
ncbi:putative bifunctional diguanylate cyclase/phosphodiesterase [Amphritea japonica]|uniref:cyclic-guanylate-specific phosphodiesterase n=1 Tax=Amphritea japonica ATCC BAA-1530 TaxID=1278309 RepID=A0A7R6P902_9GAMM|nr:EAL domain-containing protein [Amphritea japonica]BBB24771.1 signal transduction protein [Amphritea japonica ATCC BAA-1530]